MADTVRGILDGHVILSRQLAQRYHYPAVDVLDSLSRLGNKVAKEADLKAAGRLRQLLSAYYESEDLINVGAYVKGANSLVDEAIAKMPAIRDFLVQGIDERADIADTLETLRTLAGTD